MERRRIVYFVTLSSNASIVLREAIDLSAEKEILIFFDLDGSIVLDKRYLREQRGKASDDLEHLLQRAIHAGVKLFGCQMNVMFKHGFECIDHVELAGVATFLDLAYEADAILSY